MQDEDLLILGYQPDGHGEVKDLILGYYDEDGKLQCRGKVYLGISKEERGIIAQFAKTNTVKTNRGFQSIKTPSGSNLNLSVRLTSCTKRLAVVCASPYGKD